MNDAENAAGARETVEGAAAGPETILRLTAAPFTRAARLRRFVEAVEALPGVLAVARLGFRQGELSLEVAYTDSVPLSRRLQALEAFPLEIEADGDHGVRVLLTADDEW